MRTQINQVDAGNDYAAANQHTDYAKPQHGVEDNDDAEAGQEDTENERNPSIGAYHFSEVKTVRFWLLYAKTAYC